jgi:hypothetical protein
MKIALHILPGIVMLCVALSFVLVYVNTHPPRSSACIHPSDLGVPYASVEFRTEDGLTLRGWVISPRSGVSQGPAIILCQGLGADRSDLTDLAAQLSTGAILSCSSTSGPTARAMAEGRRSGIMNRRTSRRRARTFLDGRTWTDDGSASSVSRWEGRWPS